jgi:hypothetical protein
VTTSLQRILDFVKLDCVTLCLHIRANSVKKQSNPYAKLLERYNCYVSHNHCTIEKIILCNSDLKSFTSIRANLFLGNQKGFFDLNLLKLTLINGVIDKQMSKYQVSNILHQIGKNGKEKKGIEKGIMKRKQR